MRILVTDDMDIRLRQLSVLLCGLGIPAQDIELVSCQVADEAIQAIGEYGPDVLFLDFNYQPALDKSAKTGADVATWVAVHYTKPIFIATHSTRSDVRKLFGNNHNVTHFVSSVGGVDEKFLKEFLVHCGVLEQ